MMKIGQLCADVAATIPAPALPAALTQWAAGLRRAGMLSPAAPPDLATLRALHTSSGGRLLLARCFACSGRLPDAASPGDDSEDEVVVPHRCG